MNLVHCTLLGGLLYKRYSHLGRSSMYETQQPTIKAQCTNCYTVTLNVAGLKARQCPMSARVQLEQLSGSYSVLYRLIGN